MPYLHHLQSMTYRRGRIDGLPLCRQQCRKFVKALPNVLCRVADGPPGEGQSWPMSFLLPSRVCLASGSTGTHTLQVLCRACLPQTAVSESVSPLPADPQVAIFLLSPILKFSWPWPICPVGGLMASESIPVAQYLRMSTEHQKYSLENQQLAIRKYAEDHGFSIVQTYADRA